MTSPKAKRGPKKGNANGRIGPKGLNAKEERFCREYVIDLHVTRAATAAGYSEKTAGQQGSRLLTKPAVQAFIAELQAEVAEKLEISQERIVAELARIGFSNIGDYLAFGPDGVLLKDSLNLSRAQLSAVSEVTETKTEVGGSVKFKLHDKLAALEKLAKHLGMFKDKVELTGPNGGPIQMQTTPPDLSALTDEQLSALAGIAARIGPAAGESGMDH